MVRSCYEVLGLDRNASFEQIKLAFKRRALQVHPDKGGSKEAFHSVHQAFETLADTEARKKHDRFIATAPWEAEQRPRKAGSKKKATAAWSGAGRQGNSAPKKRIRERASMSRLLDQQAQLMRKLHKCIQDLPREVRHHVLSKDFSQRQRLILEKWMVDMSQAPPAWEVVPFKQKQSGTFVSSPIGTLSAAKNVKKSPDQFGQHGIGCKQRDESGGNMRTRRDCGSIRKTENAKPSCYIASIFFHGIGLLTGKCDLPTALEFLVILTTVKQKMLDHYSESDASFQQRLQDAVKHSAAEHGKRHEDLALRFCVVHKSVALLGPGFRLQSPMVRRIEDFAKMRSWMNPFRQYARIVSRNALFWLYSPEQLQDAWQQFQMAVADIWALAGLDSTGVLRRIRACHDSNTSARESHLRFWERQHMGLQDKVKNRPATRRWFPSPSTPCPDDALSAMKNLLVRWSFLLKRLEHVMENERRKRLRKRRKEQLEAQRREVLRQKRLREEERARIEILRRRRMSSSFGE